MEQIKVQSSFYLVSKIVITSDVTSWNVLMKNNATARWEILAM